MALGAGLLTFVSPCVLPLVPVYLGFLSSKSVNGELLERAVFSHALFFVLGFSVLFIALGASVGLIGNTLIGQLPLLRKIAGIFLILLGIHLMGLMRIPFLYREKRFDFTSKIKRGYFPSFLVGVSFSLGWTPCVGPILGGILVLAFASQTVFQGILLLATYSLGLAIPFLLAALAFSQISGILRRFNRYYHLVEIISGLLLILIGVFIFTDNLTLLNRYFDFFKIGGI